MNYKVVTTRLANPQEEPFIQEVECEGYAHARREMEIGAMDGVNHHASLTHGSGSSTIYCNDEPILTAQWEVIDHRTATLQQ